MLIEGLIDTFLSLVEENRSSDLRSIDANGFCQLMFEVTCSVSSLEILTNKTLNLFSFHLIMRNKALYRSRFVIANFFSSQLLQLEYFETVLNPYFTSAATESLKSLQGTVLEIAIESISEAVETPGHNRRPTRGSEDTVSDDKQSVSADDLLVTYNFLSLSNRFDQISKPQFLIILFIS